MAMPGGRGGTVVEALTGLAMRKLALPAGHLDPATSGEEPFPRADAR